MPENTINAPASTDLEALRKQITDREFRTLIVAAQYGLSDAQVFDWMVVSENAGPDYLENLRKHLSRLRLPPVEAEMA
jgi:hypothetical protein